LSYKFGADAAGARAQAAGPAGWTGFYIGAHVGAAWGTVESEIPLSQFHSDHKELSVISEHNSGLGVFPVSSHTINGFLGGVQAGYNWQVNNWLVLGVEGQFSWSDLEGSTPCIVILKCTTEVKWLGSLAGRVGFTYDRTMLYVKAGVAWADSDYLADFSIIPGVFTATASDTRTGFMIGAGIEYGFLSNWSAKLEYNYMDFDTDSLGFVINCDCHRHSDVLNVDITQRIHLIKFGINYRFGWAAPAVAARY